MKNDDVLKLNLDGWPLPDPYLVELGRVAALWSTLEGILNLCISKLAGFDINDPKAFILVTHSSFPQRLDIFSALCEQLVEEFPNLNGYEVVIQKLKKAQKLRNDYMHYGMAVNPESGDVEMAKATARGTLKTDRLKVAVSDIRRAIVTIHEGQLAIYKLVFRRDLTPMWERR